MARFRLVTIVVILSIVVDQITKVLARQKLEPMIDGYSFLGGFFSLDFTENSGAFLSMGSQFTPQIRFWIFTVFVGAILAVAGYMLLKKELNRMSVIGLSLLVGGGIGNLIDRVQKGTVTDFMQMDFYIFRTGIFNVADMLIMTGFFLLLLDSKVASNEHDRAVA